MYFLLNPDMKIVKGVKRDICHSLLDGKVHYFDSEYRNIFRDLLNKKSIEELSEYYDKELIDSIKDYLCKNYIGHFTSNSNIFVPTIRKNPSKDMGARLKKFDISSIMIRINSTCNLQCVFCRKLGDTLPAACMCYKSECSSNNCVKNILEQAIKLGIRKVELIGGEPFLEKDKVFEIMTHLTEHNIELHIHTNGALLNEDDIIELAKNKVFIIYSVYTFCKSNENRIVGVTGYTDAINKNIMLSDKHGLKYRIEFLVNKLNKDEIQGTLFKEMLSERKLIIKYLFPTSEYSICDKKYPELKVENIVLTFNNYEQAECSNICFREGPFIDVDGTIYPCIGLAQKKYKWGNIKEGLFSVYRDGKHEEYWKMSNESDPVCESCAERLMCRNCKAYRIINSEQKISCNEKK